MTSLVLTGHGSKDPRSAANTRAVAGQLARMAPGVDVRVAFCEHNAPLLPEVLTGIGDAVVVPFLLACGYHARTDIPALSGGTEIPVRQADVLGADERLLTVLRVRLGALGVSPLDGGLGVMVVAVGSSDPGANARTAGLAGRLVRGTRWAGVEVAFATGPDTSLPRATRRLYARGATRLVIAPWFLAHGRITDRVAAYAHTAGIPMAQPLGSHPLVAATALDRFEASLARAHTSLAS